MRGNRRRRKRRRRRRRRRRSRKRRRRKEKEAEQKQEEVQRPYSACSQQPPCLGVGGGGVVALPVTAQLPQLRLP